MIRAEWLRLRTALWPHGSPMIIVAEMADQTERSSDYRGVRRRA